MEKRYFLLALLLIITCVLTAQKDKKGSDVGFLPTEGDALAGSVTTAFDSTLWDKINLTSPRMKKTNKPFPWWIPFTAGGAAIVTGVILLTDGEKDTTMIPDKPIAINDNFSIPCGQNNNINPLANDSGDDIRILEVTSGTQGAYNFTDNSIRIFGDLKQDLVLSYTIIDRHNQTASAIITITLILPPIDLVNREETIHSGELVSGNIFDGGNCQECVVYIVNSEPFTNINWNANGTYSFTGPEVQEPTTITFFFQVRDRCDQVTSGTLTVIINPPCSIEPTFTIIPEDCDFENGEIRTVIDNMELYEFTWSDGSTNPILEQVSSGTYRLTVTLMSDPVCFLEFEFEVPSTDTPTVLNEDEYETVFDVAITGNVLDNDQGSGLRVIEFTPINVAQFEILENGSFVFLGGPDAEGFYEAEYTVIDTCGRTFTAIVRFNVTNPPCDFTAQITTTPADCGKPNGTASVIMSPPSGNYEILWPNGATGTMTSGLELGSYMVLINSLDPECETSFPFNIAENPPFDYGTLISSTPSTCLGDGDIVLSLQDQMGGELIVTVIRDGEEVGTITNNAGTLQIGEQIQLFPGMYTINIIEGDCPPRCAQTIEITLDEIETPLIVNDDQYTIPVNGKWNGNVLDNDQGTGMLVTDFTTPSDGMLMLDQDGNGMFMPDTDFEGTVTFIYTVTDTCGNTLTALVTITVEETPCNFIADITTTPADCGKENGAASAIINPPGSQYGINWPNGQSGPSATGFPQGSYQVSVHDPDLGCTLMFPFSIVENPPGTYLESITSSPGTCLGDGEITIMLSNPTGKPMNLNIEFEGEQIADIQLQNGTHQLRDYFNIESGTYSILIVEMDCPPRCGQTVQITVAEQDLPMTINDDEYTIEWNGFWEGNVLTNDQGTGLVVVSFTQPSSGNANINSDGTGFFVPDQDFSGTVTFTYTVQDTCGQTKTATVTIIVEEPPCDYDVTFSTTPASCGLSDGSAVISHFPNDPVTFLWSNGQTGPVLSDVSSDFYNVTLTNPVTNCVLVFGIFVDENDPDHIISVDIIPSSCNGPGDAILELEGSGQFTVLVSGPGGSSQFTAGNGIVSVGENVDLSAGSWTVIVIDDVAGSDCALTISFDLENYIPIAIELLDVIPPSSPSAEDGEIIIQIAGGNPPYIIFANSNSYGPVGPGVVVLDGLGAGVYEVFAFDESDCPSEVLIVVIDAFQGNPQSSFKAIHVSSVNAAPQLVFSLLQNTPEWQFNSSQFEKPFNLDELRLYSKLNFGATILFGLGTNHILGIDIQRNQGGIFPSGNHNFGRWSASQIHLLVGRQWNLNKIGFQLLTGPGAFDINGIIISDNANALFNQPIASWRIQPTIQYKLWKQVSISAGTNIDLSFSSFKFHATAQVSMAYNFR